MPLADNVYLSIRNTFQKLLLTEIHSILILDNILQKIDLTYFPSPKSPILMRTICVSSLETVVSCRISIVCPDSDLPRITNVTSCDAIMILELTH